jgi:hypothetical protein
LHEIRELQIYQNFLIHRCAVLVLWDLWWFGDPSKEMAPFRTHNSYDYGLKKYVSYLSRARVVIKKIESLLKEKEPELDLSKLDITASRTKFAVGFLALLTYLSPDVTKEELDRMHYGDAMYVSFYDRLLRQKKRKLAALDDLNEESN